MYELEYAAPPAPKVAARVRELLGDGVVTDSPWRGWDHGTWVPLLRMWPAADIPLLQISLPRKLSAAAQIKLGERLAPLRGDNVFILGSGNVTHNLRRVRFDPEGEASKPPAWASDFDAWVQDVTTKQDVDALANYRSAPGFAESHPTDEHFRPLLMAMGAAAASGGSSATSYPVTGFEGGSISRRCIQFG
jgi:4,5-DOPA dioxygenase extradiol